VSTFYYWMPALLNAIGTRISADTTLTAMLGAPTNVTASFPVPAVDPEGTSYPLITFAPVGSINDDTFEGRLELHTIEVHIFHQTMSLVDSMPLAKMIQIRDRLLGDWVCQTTRIPTFGLDRWTPTFPAVTGIAQTDYVADIMVFKSWVDATGFDDSGVREFVLTFEVRLEKRRPTS